MKDKIEQLACGSVIQHGPLNDRIYLLKATDRDLYSLPEKLIDLAERKNYGKIFAKLRENRALPFLSKGFLVEARIPGMFPRQREGLFLSYYTDKDRKVEEKKELYENVLSLAKEKRKDKIEKQKKNPFILRLCTPEDIPAMCHIYKTVFPTYPFPIHDPSFLLDTMNKHVDYYCAELKGAIVALSSAEKNKDCGFAEMTDFATLPAWRGNGLALHLLSKMEQEMSRQGIHSVFTIARAISPGMNITFARMKYYYGGRLKNNTNISGHIESMNVWYKSLS